jgi:nucleotide-binding universal stress UspA family protein
MLEIPRILCPTDFSDASQHALEEARMIAGWFGAAVTVLHVSPPPRVIEGPAGFAGSPTETTIASLCHARAALAESVRPLRAAGVSVDEIVLEDYDIEDCILEQAASDHADLLVMGTHGRTGLGWLIVGSVTDHVLRRAPCPVLTVPPQAIRTTKPPFTRVLCPVDFSPPSLEAVGFALRLAQEGDVHLTLLHALPDAMSTDAPARDTPAHRRRCEDSARHRLEALVPTDAWAFCEPQTRVVRGTSYRVIVDVARNESSDLIVMGVGRQRSLDRLFVGSTTNQVIRHAACPVLTVRR